MRRRPSEDRPEGGQTGKKRNNRKRVPAAAAALLILCLIALCPDPAGLRAFAAESGAAAEETATGGLVIEVVEEIPAEDMDLLEDEEVPLSAFPSDRNKAAGPLPVFLLCMAAVIASGILYLYRDRDRNRLLKQRREGYRQEMNVLHQRRDLER